MASDTNETYWSNYDGLQHAKHRILSEYLGGWFAILGSVKGQMLYVDTHAGRGRHTTGELGSPLLALQTLLDHRDKDAILKHSNVHFLFLEAEEHNCEALERELALLQLPSKISVDLVNRDFEDVINSLLDSVDRKGKRLEPSFLFIDPFGFRLSMQLLRRLMRYPRVELLINFMFRYVDMAIRHESQAANMDRLFGCPDWNSLMAIDHPDQRSIETINLFSKQLNARYVTHMRMLGTNRATKYVLLHATNHVKGRQLMKNTMWKVSPDGSFCAYQNDNPHQLMLFEEEPDLTVLQKQLFDRFAGQTIEYETLCSWVDQTMWLKKHLNTVLRDYRKENKRAFSGYEGRFSFNQNPTIRFP